MWKHYSRRGLLHFLLRIFKPMVLSLKWSEIVGCNPFGLGEEWSPVFPYPCRLGWAQTPWIRSEKQFWKEEESTGLWVIFFFLWRKVSASKCKCLNSLRTEALLCNPELTPHFGLGVRAWFVSHIFSGLAHCLASWFSLSLFLNVWIFLCSKQRNPSPTHGFGQTQRPAACKAWGCHE